MSVKVREEFLGGITKLDKEVTGSVDGYNTTISNIYGLKLNTRTITPTVSATEGAFWVNSNLPKYTNSTATYNLIATPGVGIDNVIVRYDGTNGLVQTSNLTISDTGVLSGIAAPVVTTDAANKSYVDGYFINNNNKYINFYDGTNTASAANNSDTFRFRSTTTAITTTVTNNDVTYGDNLAITLVPGNITHSTLGSLSSDDHTQYILVNGTRAFTGSQSLGNNSLNDVNTLSGYSSTQLSITSSVNIVNTAGAAGSNYITNNCGAFEIQFAGVQYELNTVNYKQEAAKAPTISSINQINSNSTISYIYAGQQIKISRIDGTGTVPVFTSVNFA